MDNIEKYVWKVQIQFNVVNSSGFGNVPVILIGSCISLCNILLVFMGSYTY